MKFFEYTFNLQPNKILNKYSDIDSLLFIDIETTGLSPSNSIIYLIGAGYYSANNYKVIQWFAENPSEEPLLIKEFFSFINSYNSLIHFNGQMFDIPFIEKRALKHNIKSPLSELNSIDIYKLLKPFKSLLGLQDLRQKTIEVFLGIYREDLYSGGELIPIYKKYTVNHSDEYLDLLLLHNKEDVLNMHNLVNVLEFEKIDDINLDYVNHSINSYETYNGEQKKELVIKYNHSLTLPNDFKSNQNGIYIYFSNNGNLLVRLPILETELKHFYEDTNNYFYLLSEDMCIHKSVACSVDKSNRKKATKTNCYTRYSGTFIPCHANGVATSFRSDYKSKEEYILLAEFDKLSKDSLEVFGKSYLSIKF